MYDPKVPNFLKLSNDEFKRINNVSAITYSTESLNWFKNKVYGNATPDLIESGNIGKRVYSYGGMVGKMCFFRYDAKLKNELPYWDAFPLTIFFGETKTSLYGLNMHYLSPAHRLILFRELMKINQATHVGAARKIYMQWEFLKRSSVSKLCKHSVKCYLKSHIKSIPVEVKWNEWHGAIFLPVERFQKKSKGYVWKDAY